MFPVSLDCTFLIAPSVFSNIYLSPVLFVPNASRSLDCQFLIVPSVVSNVYLSHVSCVPNIASVSGLTILDCPFGFL